MATKYYDEKAKERTNRYRAVKRDKLTLDLPLGTKERWRKQAEDAGAESLTKYISQLMEQAAENQA